MQPLIKKVLRYINTRINKNSKFLIIQKKKTCIHWNGYLSCRFQITVKAISYNDIKCTNKYLILDDPLFTKSIPLSVLFMILHLNMYYLLMLAPVENTDRYIFCWHKALLTAVRMPQQRNRTFPIHSHEQMFPFAWFHFEVVFTCYFITHNENSFLSKWPPWV